VQILHTNPHIGTGIHIQVFVWADDDSILVTSPTTTSTEVGLCLFADNERHCSTILKKPYDLSFVPRLSSSNRY